MSDPVVPVERGLRATVRMAAGINIGETAEDVSFFGTARRRLADGIAPLRLALWRSAIPATFPPRRGATLLRHAGLGAAAGILMVASGFAAIAAHAALTAPAEEVAMAIEVAAAKTDRLPLPPRAAAIAASIEGETPVIDEEANHAVTYSTAAVAPTAYASADPHDGDANAAIDRVLDAPAVTVTPAETEEPDDEAVVPLVLPMPRPRPAYEPATTTLPLPLPRPRPLVLASLSPSTAPSVEGPNAVVQPRSAAPEPRPPTNALGFFSSPTEPVKPPSRTTIDTPFGIPYVLQTGSVETACIKPELVDLLRRIEGRYHQKVVITSGFRDRGRQGSLHRQCAAVDIQVNGVAAADLAAYARTIPGIGGVGTYCHPHMIHVDIGTPRDWKYGCGSYFAMRGAPGKWGKVPSAVAKAQPAGVPSQTATDAEEED